MKEYTTEFIRNIALVAHGSAGKTIMAETFLNFTGATTRIGKIEDGSTTSDYDEEEIRRKISLFTSVIPVEYKNFKINFLDAPGYTDFIGEAISALSVSEGALVLVDALAGVEVGTELAWRNADQFNLPRFVVINKMDRENANHIKVLESVTNLLHARLIKIQLPIGEKLGFKGVVDLLTMKAYLGDGKTASDIPAEMADEVEEARMALAEAAAESDEALLEKYLDSGALTDEELLIGLRKVINDGTYTPVLFAATGHSIGVAPILNAIVELMPSPAQRPGVIAQGKMGDETLVASDAGHAALYVWKTTADSFVGKVTYFKVLSGTLAADTHLWNNSKEADERMSALHLQRGKEQIPMKLVRAGDIAAVSKLNVTVTGDTLCEKNHPLTIPIAPYPAALYRVAVQPKTQADAAKISTTLTRLCEEDLTLSWFNEPATRQTILQGMGDQHIDVAVRRAENKFQVHFAIEEPKVPYREGITRKASAQYRHKKQSGGSGQFGEVHLRIEPYPEGNFLFADELVGMNLSKSYLAPIEKGIRAALEQGVFAGYPLSNVKVIVYDGKEHPVDSKPVAFETAGREAFKLAVEDAGPVLFEPVMALRVVIPDANMGDVMGDLNTRRGRVQGTETERGNTVINAHVPLAEVLRYTTQLRSLTGGRGYFTMEPDHYDTVPQHLAQGIVDAHRKEMEAKKEE